MSKSVAAIFATLLLVGCVPCWNPLFTDADLTSDPKLVGTFIDDEGKDSWAFTKTGENKYKLAQTDSDGLKAEFDVRLVKVKDRRFLDLYLTNAPELKINALAGCALVSAHLILRVDEIGAKLTLAAMNPDWLHDYLKEHPNAVEHRLLAEDRVVITAPTKQLQEFVLSHAEGEGLFGGASCLKRWED